MNRFCMLIVLGWSAFAQSTNPALPPRKETITITDAPTAKDQIRQELDGKIKKSVELATKGNTTEALKLLDEAFEMTMQQAFLGYFQGRILAYKGQIHLLRRESDLAISAFVRRLDFNKDACSKAVADGLPYSQECADAHKDLANALLSAGKNEECLEHALIAAENYELSTRDGQPASEAARQGARTEASEALLIAGAANSRLGKKSEARDLTDRASKTLEAVIVSPQTSAVWKAQASELLKIAKQQASQL